jgi:hypothetical protein
MKSSPASASKTTPSRKRHLFWRVICWTFLVMAIVLGIGRAILPWALRDYINRTLSHSQMYTGRIGGLRINLWRGAYAIQDIVLNKTTGSVPVPFFSAKTVEFAIPGKALLHRRIVGRVKMIKPEINFVDAESDDETQTGAGAPWLQIIKDLFPFKINSAVIQEGMVHFRTYQKQVPVDIYLSQVEGSIDNLGNIQDLKTPLPATVTAKAMVMDKAKLEFNMTLDPFSYRPTFHMATRLLGLDLTEINALALAYGKFDFKRGWLDLVIETDSKEGQVVGYVKPLFRNLKVFSLTKDLQDDNVLQFFWQALIGGVVKIFKNQPRDQLGTIIPFSGNPDKTSTDILATLGNVLYNAFIRAYLPRLEASPGGVESIQFESPQVSDAISGDAL